MNKGMTSILYSSMFVFTNVWDLRFTSIYIYIYIDGDFTDLWSFHQAWGLNQTMGIILW